MPNTPAGMRQCPTRADGTNALFAHVIAHSLCQERQRGFYHKCPSCSFCNPRSRSEPAAKGLNGHALPAVPRLPPPEVHARNGVNGAAHNGRVEPPAMEPTLPVRPDAPVVAAEVLAD